MITSCFKGTKKTKKIMNEQYKVSIIVAVYNVEHYIHRCIDSLLKQTYRNIEIILVDDGSSDNSPAICDEYAAKDNRVKVIHKPNGGVSTARQAGLDACTGDYVIHADPDDYADGQMIASLLQKAIDTNADIVTCDFYMNEKVMPQLYKNSSELLRNLIDVESICVCWNTFVKRSFISEHNVSFTPSWLCLSEDFLFICRLLVAGATAVHLPMAFYHYWVTNGESLTNKRSEKKLKSIIGVIDELGKIVNGKDYDDFYIRKKYAIQYAYHAKMFSRIRTVYPEVHSRMKANGNWETRCMFGKFSMFVYYYSRIRYYWSKMKSKI